MLGNVLRIRGAMVRSAHPTLDRSMINRRVRTAHHRLKGSDCEPGPSLDIHLNNPRFSRPLLVRGQHTDIQLQVLVQPLPIDTDVLILIHG